MKVLETLGQSDMTDEKGFFRYRRDSNGVIIKTASGKSITISDVQWLEILKKIAPNTIHALSSDLYPVIDSTMSSLLEKWDKSFIPYICAILEHEGTLDLFAGQDVDKKSYRIHLVKRG